MRAPEGTMPMPRGRGVRTSCAEGAPIAFSTIASATCFALANTMSRALKLYAGNALEDPSK